MSFPRAITFGMDETQGSVWRRDAACQYVAPDVFFPEKGGSSRMAKRICAVCPVKQMCLEESLRRGERYGIWGGLSERERRKRRAA